MRKQAGPWECFSTVEGDYCWFQASFDGCLSLDSLVLWVICKGKKSSALADWCRFPHLFSFRSRKWSSDLDDSFSMRSPLNKKQKEWTGASPVRGRGQPGHHRGQYRYAWNWKLKKYGRVKFQRAGTTCQISTCFVPHWFKQNYFIYNNTLTTEQLGRATSKIADKYGQDLTWMMSQMSVWSTRHLCLIAVSCKQVFVQWLPWTMYNVFPSVAQRGGRGTMM